MEFVASPGNRRLAGPAGRRTGRCRLRILAVCVVLVTAACVTAVQASAASAHKPRCAVPHGWKLVAKDSQVVVIAQRHKQSPAYDYCNRTVGKEVRMNDPQPAICAGPGIVDCGVLVDLRLAGRYVAYETRGNGQQPVWLWDTLTGKNNEARGVGASPVLLSPNGVALAIVAVASKQGPATFWINVLTLTSDLTPDSSEQASDLANLQLYDCGAGCAPNATIVAWTHSGVQRYAQVQP